MKARLIHRPYAVGTTFPVRQEPGHKVIIAFHPELQFEIGVLL